MKKRNIIILSIVILVSVFIVIAAIALSNKKSGVDVSVENSTISKDNYYVEKGLEDLAKIVKPAVENYLSQDRSESVDLRNKRLGKYFSSDSPAYSYGTQNIDTAVYKSKATVTSVTSSDAEGTELCLIVMTETTFYFKGGSNSETQSYWISLKKDTAGEYTIPYDIGIWE